MRVRGVATTMSSLAASGGRVLCLHGGGTNAEIMRVQTAKLRHQLRGEMEFEFLEGTHENLYVDRGIQRRFAGPFLSWYDVQHDAVRSLRLEPSVRSELSVSRWCRHAVVMRRSMRAGETPRST